MAMCSMTKGEMKHGDAATKTSKADLVAALKASGELCDDAYSGMTDADGAAIVRAPLGNKSAKLGLLNFNVSHDNEMYGTIAVYLRLRVCAPSDRGSGGPPRKQNKRHFVDLAGAPMRPREQRRLSARSSQTNHRWRGKDPGPASSSYQLCCSILFGSPRQRRTLPEMK